MSSGGGEVNQVSEVIIIKRHIVLQRNEYSSSMPLTIVFLDGRPNGSGRNKHVRRASINGNSFVAISAEYNRHRAVNKSKRSMLRIARSLKFKFAARLGRANGWTDGEEWREEKHRARRRRTDAKWGAKRSCFVHWLITQQTNPQTMNTNVIHGK